MLTNRWRELASVLLLASCAGIGCAPSASPTTPPSTPATASTEGEIHGIGGSPTEKERIETVLAELPPDDRAAVIKQQVCPVSGKKLGTMGSPINVEYQNRSVWICCSACKEDLIANFDAHLEKLSDVNKQ